MQNDWRQVADDPRYREIARRRARLAALLTVLMLLAYFGFVLLVAFDKALLARPIGSGVTTLGVPVAIGVILLGFALTAIYVHRANRLDTQLRAMIEDAE